MQILRENLYVELGRRGNGGDIGIKGGIGRVYYQGRQRWENFSGEGHG